MFKLLERIGTSFASLLITMILMAAIFFGLLPAILFLAIIGVVSAFVIWVVLALVGFLKGLAGS